MKPYYERDGIVIYHGDCRDVLPTLGPVDHVITDPPYNVRADDIDLEGRSAMRRDFGEWDQEWHPSESLCQWHRLMRLGGSVLAFTSDRLISEYRTSMFKPRGTIVWEKDNPAPSPRPGYVQATEWIVWLQKEGAKAVWNANGYTTNVLNYPVCAGNERGDHPTPKPLALLKELVARHTDPGETILDPFMGSGTTLRAAKDLGRKAIGIEISERWCEVAARRLEQAVLPLSFEKVQEGERFANVAMFEGVAAPADSFEVAR